MKNRTKRKPPSTYLEASFVWRVKKLSPKRQLWLYRTLERFRRWWFVRMGREEGRVRSKFLLLSIILLLLTLACEATPTPAPAFGPSPTAIRQPIDFHVFLLQ